MSDITKKQKRTYQVLKLISISITILPVLIYTILAFIQGTAVEKFTLGSLSFIAIILTFINIMFKYHIRSVIWILFIGIYIILQNILPLIIILALGTILDEFLITPLARKYKQKFVINKEFDNRAEI